LISSKSEAINGNLELS